MFLPTMKPPASRYRIEVELRVNGVSHTVVGGVDPLGFLDVRETYLEQAQAGNDAEFNFQIQYVN